MHSLKVSLPNKNLTRYLVRNNENENDPSKMFLFSIHLRLLFRTALLGNQY